MCSSFQFCRLVATIYLLFYPTPARYVLAQTALTCGTTGDHDYGKGGFYMGNFFFGAPDIFGLCADFCKADSPRCLSFRYSYYDDSGGQYCEFFGMAINTTWFKSDNESPYYYFDIKCDGFPSFAGSGGTTTKTVTSSSTIPSLQTITKTSTFISTTTTRITVVQFATVTSTSTYTTTVARTTTTAVQMRMSTATQTSTILSMMTVVQMSTTTLRTATVTTIVTFTTTLRTATIMATRTVTTTTTRR
ncbi:hypothetical protein B0J11DRAFT_505166 [Dendryphion nanum]|uniref:Apple domain-containing protein n=1 Tax=Dendryphion nanum TaxID=256645 RepID=A0A9P9IQD6_9PLEO|nr:hypothetical protein B0J11DRAFT_505166 [Dendryphion nanum]